MKKNLILVAAVCGLILAGGAAAVWQDKTPRLIVKKNNAPLYELAGEPGTWGATPHDVIARIPKGTRLRAVWTYDVKHYLIYHVRFEGKDGYVVIGDAVPVE